MAPLQVRPPASVAIFLDAPPASQDAGAKPAAGVKIKDGDVSSWGAWLGWTKYRPLSMGAGVAFTALVLLVLTSGRPQRLILGEDNRYSGSKFQVFLWFFIVISAYLTVFLVRLKAGVVGGIGIPPHLLLLSGFSAVSFAGAKAITTSKVNNAAAMGLNNPKPAAAAAAAVGAAAGVRSLKELIGDLTSNDGLKVPNPQGGAPLLTVPMLDLGDTQMIVITLVAVLTYLVIVYTYLGSTDFSAVAVVSLPDVDSTLLSLFGLGQGAYLSKKAVGNAGEA